MPEGDNDTFSPLIIKSLFLMLDFIGEASCLATSMFVILSEFCSPSSVDTSFFDRMSSELHAISTRDAIDGIGIIPSFGGSRFADMHVSPLMTIGGIIAFAIMNIDVMMFRSLSKVIDLLMVTSSIITHTIVAGVD